jgi:hypothetical protein
MSQHALLLIVERLLPEDSSPSLAFAWEISMLCNVGDRAPTAGHSGRLLPAAAFEITGQHRLPLEVSVISVAEASGSHESNDDR